LRNSIIQDSKEDWENEAITMQQVYEAGVCNLAACIGQGSNHSLFTTRDPVEGKPVIHTHQYKGQTVKFSLVPDWPRFIGSTSMLYTRNWVVQERLLSKRTICFARHPFFECREGFVNEAFSSTIRKKPFIFPQRNDSEKLWINKSSGHVPILNWMKVTARYSSCKLTYHSDKLIALSGLAKKFQTILHCNYFSGLWDGDYLIPLLMWEVEHHDGSRERASEYQG
jgi:hypothetical protein